MAEQEKMAMLLITFYITITVKYHGYSQWNYSVENSLDYYYY